MIPFNIPAFTGDEYRYIQEAVCNKKISGDGIFTEKCSEWICKHTKTRKALLTTSGTHSLEMAAFLCDITAGDEIIMPSFTFVSTANAFLMAKSGAKIVFVDIRPDTMNIDEKLIESAITKRTKVIVPVHYAGVSCEMDEILDIAHRHHLVVVEDAAQGMMSRYKGRALGTMGEFGCVSFHETKNITMGEGGALLINDDCYTERAEIIREKGTNRSKFWRGEIDKYTWVDKGSSYLPSDINAAYLWAQLLKAQTITENRMKSWNHYWEGLFSLKEGELIELPYIPSDCTHNAHMFYIKTKDLKERTELLSFLKSRKIGAVFHYVPLHSSVAGKKYGFFNGEDKYTTRESDRLIRLPLYYGITDEQIETVIFAIKEFYGVLL